MKEEWKKLVLSGQIHIGEPCAPYTISRYISIEGNVQMKEVKITGRKIPLEFLRKKTLKNQEKFMKIYSDEKVQSKDSDDLKRAIAEYQPNIHNSSFSTQELRDMICKHQRTRTLVMWHDHATLLGRGYILITIHTLYDPAVFVKEYHKSKISVQATVEELQLYLIALNAPTIEDQAGIIPDRVADLIDLGDPIYTSDGTEIKDILKFFTGDHPAKQFERGTQMGGHYKCGSCGCKSGLMDDQAHALMCKTCTVKDLQRLATEGLHGKVPCSIKPLYVPDLTVKEIRDELKSRGVMDVTRTRKGSIPIYGPLESVTRKIN